MSSSSSSRGRGRRPDASRAGFLWARGTACPAGPCSTSLGPEHAGTEILSRIENGALDAGAVTRLAGGKPCGPAAAASERRYRDVRWTDALQFGDDVVDPEADVVKAVAVGIQPGGERVILGERFDQLKPGVAEVEVGEANWYLRRIVDGDDLEPR